MGVGLVLTAVIGALLMQVWGAPAIAAGNAAGITVAAVLMLTGLRGRPEAVSERAVGKSTATLLGISSVAGLSGFAACQLMRDVPAPLTLIAGAVVVTAVFVALGIAMGVREIRQLGGLVGVVRHA
jgi:putative peptidoglycan lipid II flippase